MQAPHACYKNIVAADMTSLTVCDAAFVQIKSWGFYMSLFIHETRFNYLQRRQ